LTFPTPLVAPQANREKRGRNRSKAATKEGIKRRGGAEGTEEVGKEGKVDNRCGKGKE